MTHPVSDIASVFLAVAEALRAHADELNRLDAEAGDGDLGVTATNIAAAITRALSSSEAENLAKLLRSCGTAIAREAPSTAGTLLASGLLGAGRRVAEDPSEGADALAELLGAASGAIAARGGAEPGSRTMLDALAPAARAARETASSGGSALEVLEAAAAAADTGTKATVTMPPRFGRAAWIPERAAGHEDAGARLVAIVLASAAMAARDVRVNEQG
jgi:dihydroxyacetone kinase